jgi:hypothetical protein
MTGNSNVFPRLFGLDEAAPRPTTPNVADGRKQQDDVHHNMTGNSTVFPRLFGLDEAAPRITFSKTYNTLPSLPQEYGLLAAPSRPLVVYNPTILPIPANALAKLSFSDQTIKPVYFASFRVSLTTLCLNRWQREIADNKTFGSPDDFVGLAVLDKDLGIIADVVINFSPQVRTGKRKRQPKFEDARLFLLNETIYLSHAVLLVPIEISTKTGDNNSDTDGIFQNHFGDGLVVSTPKGMNRRYHLKIPRGKNFNFFQSSNGSTWLELHPMDPRSTLKVEFESPANREDSIYISFRADSEERPEPSFRNDLKKTLE